MTEAGNHMKEGDLVAHFRSAGVKISKHIVAMDKLLPELTIEEIHRLRRELAIHMLVHDDPDPELRREFLSMFDTCPCCQGWLGHNQPPGARAQQGAFDFDGRD